MLTIIETEVFSRWLDKLRDRNAKTRIQVRIDRLQLGHFGDAKSVGGDISEMRVDVGPGYRVYFTRQGNTVVVLLCGGDKNSQRKDIRKARQLCDNL